MISIRYHNRGFSLLEVLVAFSILALSLGIVFQIFHKGTHATILGKEYAYAAIIAQSRLDALNIEENRDSNQHGGIIDDKYQWQVDIQPLPDDSESKGQPVVILNKINVEVSWRSLGKQHFITLNSLKLFPAQ